MTAPSTQVAGAGNYTRKHNMRRFQDRELPSEGYVKCWPNPSIPLNFQNLPAKVEGDPITFVGEVRRPNGHSAIIAATKTKIYRYLAGNDGDYAEDGYWEDAPEADAPYGMENAGEWVLIGSGFSASGNRWVSALLNGNLVMTNGVDLPVVIRVEDVFSKPLYELRDAGIVTFNTCAEYSGIFWAADVTVLTDEGRNKLFSMTDSGATTASQVGPIFSGTINANINDGTLGVAGNVVTASGSIFTAGMVGKKIHFFNGVVRTITAFTSATVVEIDGDAINYDINQPFLIRSTGTTDYVVTSSSGIFTESMVGEKIVWDSGETRTIVAFTNASSVIVSEAATVASGEFSITNPAAYKPYNSGGSSRIQHRVIWSMPGEVTRWNPSFEATAVQGSRVITLSLPNRSFRIGQTVVVSFAGINGGNLVSRIVGVSGGGTKVTLEEEASESTSEGVIQALDSASSIIGFYDVQGEDSLIQTMKPMGNFLVIYKPTEIYFLSFTGDLDAPVSISRVYQGPNGLAYRHVIFDFDNQTHVFAGEHDFFALSLYYQSPQQIPQLYVCRDLFYDRVSLSDAELVFAAMNHVTREAWIAFPMVEGIGELRLDLITKTVSTSDHGLHCMATIQKPVSSLPVYPQEDWFLMGIGDGFLYRYGKVNRAWVRSGNTRVTVSGNTATADADIFLPEHVGSTIIFELGSVSCISEYTDARNVTIGDAVIATSQKFTIVPSIWNRDGAPFQFLLDTGYEAFGDEFDDKWLNHVTPLFAYQSISSPVKIEFFYQRNANDGRIYMGEATLDANLRKAGIPITIVATYFIFCMSGQIYNSHPEYSGMTLRYITSDSRSRTKDRTAG